MVSSTILLLAAKRPSASRLIFDFDRILSRARHSGAIDVSLSLSSIKLGLYPAWSLRGSESRQPSSAGLRSSCVGSLRARHRHRHRPIRKRNVDGAGVACAAPAREPTDENSTLLFFDDLGSTRRRGCFLVVYVRARARRGNHHLSAAWLGLL